MSDTVIRVENLSKAYRIGLKEEIPDTLVAAMSSWARSPVKNFRRLRRMNTFGSNGDDEDKIWALKDVFFEVKRGEVVGIIGRNGAGKSTLLKILSRITDPTSGRAVIHGRVSSLLEVGTGFHPELTGRENIYMNGTILGMTKREIDRKFDEIVDFSGVEKFLDTPVKRYSSGMSVRLAFAVASHLEPEILIIDEVLAVGDAEFQRRCLRKMHGVARGGRTVLFVTHNMAAIQHLCTRAILLGAGNLLGDADPDRIIRAYLTLDDSAEHAGDLAQFRAPSMTPVIQECEIVDEQGSPTLCVLTGSSVTFRVRYRASSVLRNACFGIRVEALTGENLLFMQTLLQHGANVDMPESGTVSCHVEEFPLVPGRYLVTFGCSSNGLQLDLLERAIALNVEAADIYGTCRLPRPSQAKFLVKARWTLPARVGEVSSNN